MTRVTRHVLSLLVLGTLLGGVGPALAADAVLVVPDANDEKAAEAARGRVQILVGEAVPPERTRSLDDLVAETGYAALVLEGTAVFTCKGPALDASGFDARLGGAMRSVDELELQSASEALTALRADLPCSVAAIPARQLHDLFFFSGLMSAYDGMRDDAIGQFARAAALKPDVSWNESYDPKAQQLFLLGKEQALTAGMVTLNLVPPTDAERVWVDGREMESAGPTVTELKPGTHVIHVETASGAIRAAGVDLPAGEALWADPRAAAAAVQGGVVEGPAALAAEQLLALGASSWDTDTLYTYGSRGVLRYTVEGGLVRPQRPLTPVGDRVGIRVGGGVLVREAPFRKPFAYAAPSLEVDVGILRGLEATVFARVGFASFSEDTLSILPVWGGGLQWAFAGVTLKPFIGAQVAFIANQRATDQGLSKTLVSAGGLARIGAILTPIRRQALRVGLGVSFGWIDGIHASVSATVGFGLRPRSPAPTD